MSSSSSSSSSSRSAASCLRLGRFDETEHEPECKQRLLLKQLQGSSCRSLGHDNDCDADDEDDDEEHVDGNASSQHRNNRLKPFWFRRISRSSSAGGASARRRVIKRHCSWDEGRITNSSHRLQVLASRNNPRDKTDAADDESNSINTPEPVALIGSSTNSVFSSMGGGVRARIQHNHSSRKSTSTDPGTCIMAVPDRKPIPQQEPAGGLGLDELSWSMEDYDDDHCSIDPDMPPVHVQRWMASSTPTMDHQHQKQHQRPPVLQCSFTIKAGGGGGGPIFPSPSPTDSNVTRSDDDDDDDDLEYEDLRQLSFCPISLVDESSLAALPQTPPPPPPSPMMDRWSPSPPLTIKMFCSEPPKLPTRGGGGARQRHEEEELSSCPLSPPKLPTRRPKMVEHEILLASANPATSAIPPLPPSPPLPHCAAVSPLGDVGGWCPLAKPIARTAVPLPRGTCGKLLCDNGGIIVATESAKSAATAPSTDPATTVRNIAEDDDEIDDGDDDSVVSPLIGGFMAEYGATSPHQLGYGYHHHGIQQKNSHNAVLGNQQRGILKDNDVVIRGHDKGIHESAFSHGAQPCPQSEEPKKKKRNVTFGRIHIREYERVLGDNPSCSIGPPISLGWMHWDLHDSTLDAYETSQKSQRPASTRPPQRGKRDFYLSPSRRCELILHEWQSCPRVEEVRRLAPQCEDAALLGQYRRGKLTVESRSKSSLPLTVAALLCKPSVDDSDTSQPTNLHGRRQGGGPRIATTTMSKSTPHEQGENDDDDDDESKIEHDSEV